MSKSSEKFILDAANSPPKRLREFLPFVLPLAVIVLLLGGHALLFWISQGYGESGLFVQQDGRYVEALSGIREFILGMSFLTIFSFIMTCYLGYLLWQHKKVIHELWKKTQDSA